MTKKAFEDALDLLDFYATGDEVEARNYRRQGDNDGAKLLEEKAQSCRAAIAFLEAGQKMDRERCLILADEIPMPDLRDELRLKVRGEIRALLGALPKGD